MQEIFPILPTYTISNELELKRIPTPRKLRYNAIYSNNGSFEFFSAPILIKSSKAIVELHSIFNYLEYETSRMSRGSIYFY